ncbi:MAG TPA: enoyl-CoA hydratase/isomerase family protein [Candidatus Binataceae bacterium]|nr:enoyl-CoA hydratase/isomerase family protein [Candidatus Binataceae bacterium]
MSDYQFIQVDNPDAGIRRISLNRPEKRNALSNALRAELFDALRKADVDPAIGAIILRGNGKCFSAGYDLSQSPNEPLPRHISPGEGTWPRHLVDGWFEMWDMATPVIAQVHGYCLAGGSELATACDLVYVADDAQIGYPPVRSMSTPDCAYHPWLMGMRRAMEMMLTGDSITGIEAAQVDLPIARFLPIGLKMRCSISHGVSRKSRATCKPSTSASCIARWKSRARAPRSGPRRKFRRYASISRRHESICPSFARE